MKVSRVVGQTGASSGRHRQPIAPLVLFHPRVAPHPPEFDGVPSAQLQHPFPEVRIYRVLPLVSLPAVGLPALSPTLGHGIYQILGVAIKSHPAGLPQGFQGYQGRCYLHAVVSSQLKSTRQILSLGTVEQDRAVAAGSGIAQTRAIGIDSYLLASRQMTTRPAISAAFNHAYAGCKRGNDGRGMSKETRNPMKNKAEAK